MRTGTNFDDDPAGPRGARGDRHADDVPWPGVAEPPRALHRALPRRRFDRCGRPRDRGVPVAYVAPANRRREQNWRQRQHGIETAAKSPADGYTVLVATDAVSVNPHVYRMNIDPLRELVPVIHVSHQPMVLAAHPSLGIASLAELIALAKQQPGLRYATGSGIGSPQHMVVQWFAQTAGIKLEQVPYRGGAPAINDLLAGHVKLGSLGSTPLIPHYKAGTLRLLAQSMAARSPSLPDVPT